MTSIKSVEIKELAPDQAPIFSKKLSEESEDYLKYFIPFAEYSEDFIKKILTEKKNDTYFGLFLMK